MVKRGIKTKLAKLLMIYNIFHEEKEAHATPPLLKEIHALNVYERFKLLTFFYKSLQLCKK